MSDWLPTVALGESEIIVKTNSMKRLVNAKEEKME